MSFIFMMMKSFTNQMSHSASHGTNSQGEMHVSALDTSLRGTTLSCLVCIVWESIDSIPARLRHKLRFHTPQRFKIIVLFVGHVLKVVEPFGMRLSSHNMVRLSLFIIEYHLLRYRLIESSSFSSSYWLLRVSLVCHFLFLAQSLNRSVIHLYK